MHKLLNKRTSTSYYSPVGLSSKAFSDSFKVCIIFYRKKNRVKNVRYRSSCSFVAYISHHLNLGRIYNKEERLEHIIGSASQENIHGLRGKSILTFSKVKVCPLVKGWLGEGDLLRSSDESLSLGLSVNHDWNRSEATPVAEFTFVVVPIQYNCAGTFSLLFKTIGVCQKINGICVLFCSAKKIILKKGYSRRVKY